MKKVWAGIVVSVLLLMAKFGLDFFPLSATRSVESLKPLLACYESKSLSRYSFGMENAIADWLWVNLLQSASHEPLKKGEVSWEFAQVNSIVTLDSHFNRAYDLGSIFLSVFRRDKLGAKLILEKWVTQKPTSWRPNYLLGYHMYIELNDYKTAAEYLLHASSLAGAPAYLASLGIRLISETGLLNEGLRLAVELYSNVTSSEGRYRLLRRIRKLRFELEKQKWEAVLTEFRNRYRREPSVTSDLLLFLRPGRDLATSVRTEESEIVEALSEKIPFGYSSHQRKIIYQGQDDFLVKDNVGIYRQNGE